MKVKSPAKLNLHLEVIKKRTDGFHELRTVFQLIDLCDEIEFKSAPPIPPTPICAVLKRLFFNCEINDDGKRDRDAYVKLFFTIKIDCCKNI